jgi:(1->4)-alpha-D-glucan 1-alpha-D-glucosylmutase
MSHLRIPVATYRLQFNQQFRFKDAGELVSYLYRLGISDLYTSPILKTRTGSSHGYDVTDPTCLNPELGTGEDLDALDRELKRYGMGLLLDIVPNHMAASPENPWWQDVLEKGNNSCYADYFDLNWLDSGKDKRKQTGYRRFFDIGDLIGIRVEDPRVFEAAHSLILKLIAEGKITGLRIDHIDGLYDPLEYLLRLQRHLTQPGEADKESGFYVVVEKILSGDETLPEEWPVSGTTGYDFTNTVNALFLDGVGAKSLDRICSHFVGEASPFSEVVYDKKKQVMAELFPEEMKALGQYLGQLLQRDRNSLVPSPEELTGVLIEVTAGLPVYRTYTRAWELSARDRLCLERAFNEAERLGNQPNAAALNSLRQVLLLDAPTTLPPEQREARLEFVLKWQQLTGAIMAKGFEDTALYSYNRLISLNEVGGNPASAGVSVDEFHHLNRTRRQRWPHTLNASSTHDTKRSEDVRARINVLSEIPEEWEGKLAEWSHWNQPKKSRLNGLYIPEPNTEMLIYQTLIGAWPIHQEELPDFKERLKAYMIKAVREAKVHTRWLSPNEDYEAALIEFMDSILESSENNPFMEDLLRFEKKTAFYGALNSLAQVLLKITSPGLPDFYQGTELWDFSLVDPDNRRLVSFPKRAEFLDELIQKEVQGQQSLVKRISTSWQDGRVKLYVTHKALDTRRRDRDVFQEGNYMPLCVEGKGPEHICAFARNKGGKWAITVVPRLLVKLVDAGTFPCGQPVWGNDILILPEDTPPYWLNIFTGERLGVSGGRKALSLAEILRIFPVALLRNC